MIAIADSGSTKTTWSFVDGDGTESRQETGGINPYYQSDEEMKQLLEEALLGKTIDTVHFYGAGCTPAKQPVVERLLAQLLPNAKVEVESDLLGAARGLCGVSPGIACILGTGSNSCQYDGTLITHNVSPLGFILGDEGSGAYLGKRLVGDLLKGQLPAELKDAFLKIYKLTMADIIERVYRQPFPNRFLASFSPFILEHIEQPDVRLLVADSFRTFLERNVMQYDYAHHGVHFVGSVAWHYREILHETATHLGLTVGEIEQSPMAGLVIYHTTL